MDGAFGGWIRELNHGQLGDVYAEPLGADHLVKKNVGAINWDTFSFKMGSSNSRSLYEWIRANQNGEYSRKNPTFTILDEAGNAWRTVETHNALLTEIDFPALDADAKGGATFTLKLQPEEAKWSGGSGRPVGFGTPTPTWWSAANFRVQVDGLDTTRVATVNAITFRQTVIDDAIGAVRDPVTQPARISISDLKITVPSTDRATYAQWAESTANGSATPKSGAILYLDSSNKEIARLSLSNLRFVKISPGGMVNNVLRVRIDMSIEKAILTPAAGTAF